MPEQYRPLSVSLRSRLLCLTVVFVLLVETFVFLPSIAAYRENYLDQRLAAAQIAALSLEEAPNNMISPELEESLLTSSGVIAIAIRRKNKSHLLGFDRMPADVDASFDNRDKALIHLITEAIATLNAAGERIIRVVGHPKLKDTAWIEITMDEAPLYRALKDYSANLWVLSLMISILTGGLVYAALHWMVVRPMRRVRKNIIAFRRDPENADRILKQSDRSDEIGVVERELSRMQQELRRNLHAKAHLADLGEAVSKINHDLRNMLATANISSEALSSIDDPRINRIAGRMERALGGAISLCERTLRHGKAEEPAPNKKSTPLMPIVEDIKDALLLDSMQIDFKTTFSETAIIYSDPDQLFRILLNLCRNAIDAQKGKGKITLHYHQSEEGNQIVSVEDAGPGIPEDLQARLFKPFMSAGQAGGTGLGLAIARELAQMHGGQLQVARTSKDGTLFTVSLPSEEKA